MIYSTFMAGVHQCSGGGGHFKGQVMAGWWPSAYGTIACTVIHSQPTQTLQTWCMNPSKEIKIFYAKLNSIQAWH